MTINLLFFTIIIKSNKPTVEEAQEKERQRHTRESHVVELLKHRKMM